MIPWMTPITVLMLFWIIENTVVTTDWMTGHTAFHTL